jgi:hypothetical protein
MDKLDLIDVTGHIVSASFIQPRLYSSLKFSETEFTQCRSSAVDVVRPRSKTRTIEKNVLGVSNPSPLNTCPR